MSTVEAATTRSPDKDRRGDRLRPKMVETRFGGQLGHYRNEGPARQEADLDGQLVKAVHDQVPTLRLQALDPAGQSACERAVVRRTRKR